LAELLKIFGKPWGVLDFLVRFVSRQNEQKKVKKVYDRIISNAVPKELSSLDFSIRDSTPKVFRKTGQN